jgi:hypothetical protein
MNTNFTSTAAAILLSVTAIASPALAQNHAAPAGTAAATVSSGLEARSYDDITTGSIGYGRRYDSAQEGNANQPNFVVQQYGQTSGGPRR